jgi:hypothetical protein
MVRPSSPTSPWAPTQPLRPRLVDPEGTGGAPNGSRSHSFRPGLTRSPRQGAWSFGTVLFILGGI